jgi:hypothetical protein
MALLRGFLSLTFINFSRGQKQLTNETSGFRHGPYDQVIRSFRFIIMRPVLAQQATENPCKTFSMMIRTQQD